MSRGHVEQDQKAFGSAAARLPGADQPRRKTRVSLTTSRSPARSSDGRSSKVRWVTAPAQWNDRHEAAAAASSRRLLRDQRIGQIEIKVGDVHCKKISPAPLEASGLCVGRVYPFSERRRPAGRCAAAASPRPGSSTTPDRGRGRAAGTKPQVPSWRPQASERAVAAAILTAARASRRWSPGRRREIQHELRRP